MYRFRFSIILTIAWLAFVLNLNNIFNKLDIAIHIQAFVPFLAIGAVVIMMLVLKTHKINTTFTILALLALYTVAKVMMPVDLSIDYLVAGMIVELIMILGTFFVTRPVIEWLGSYNNRIKSAVFSADNTLVQKGYNSTAAIERKISLARRFDRELSLLYIPMSSRFDEFGEIKAVALQSQMGELIDVLVGKSGLYTWNNGDLMICLQGDAVKHVNTIAEQFSAVIGDVLKMKVQVGIAEFPSQGLILEDLIDIATTTLHQPRPSNPSIAASVVELFPKPAPAAQTVSA